MRTCTGRAFILLISAVVASCASTKVVEQTPMSQVALARPDRIWVYDFIATPTDMPADSSIIGGLSVGGPSSAEQAAMGRQLGALIAQKLVEDINAMGLSAVQAGPGSAPQIGDGVIRGYLVSVEGGGAGSAVKRFVIGFGAGTSEMDTIVEGFVMTPQGLRKLGSGTLSSSGGKTPGAIVPAAVTIATGNPVGLIVVGGMKLYGEASGRSGPEGRAKATADLIAEQLKIRFQDRGWIS